MTVPRFDGMIKTTSEKAPAFVANARPLFGKKRKGTHSCSAEQGNPVQTRNTTGRSIVRRCCKRGACPFSAKAGHWPDSPAGKARGVRRRKNAGTRKSEDLQKEGTAPHGFDLWGGKQYFVSKSGRLGPLFYAKSRWKHLLLILLAKDHGPSCFVAQSRKGRSE